MADIGVAPGRRADRAVRVLAIAGAVVDPLAVGSCVARDQPRRRTTAQPARQLVAAVGERGLGRCRRASWDWQLPGGEARPAGGLGDLGRTPRIGTIESTMLLVCDGRASSL